MKVASVARSASGHQSSRAHLGSNSQVGLRTFIPSGISAKAALRIKRSAPIKERSADLSVGLFFFLIFNSPRCESPLARSGPAIPRRWSLAIWRVKPGDSNMFTRTKHPTQDRANLSLQRPWISLKIKKVVLTPLHIGLNFTLAACLTGLLVLGGSERKVDDKPSATAGYQCEAAAPSVTPMPKFSKSKNSRVGTVSRKKFKKKWRRSGGAHSSTPHRQTNLLELLFGTGEF